MKTKKEKWYQFTFKVKPKSKFRFNEEGDLLKEVNIIALNEPKAWDILKNSYPHFRKNQITVPKKVHLKGLFK